MFEGSKYKQIAKKMLKGRLGVPILVILISTLVALLVATPSIVSDNLVGVSASFVLVVCGVSIFSFVVSGIIEMAISYFFLKLIENEYEKITFNSFLDGLSLCWKGILVLLRQTFFLVLWLLIPVLGIIFMFIKGISYSQMYFIVAENPGISVSKAMQVSKTMTQGRKADLFWLGLSFIGWFLLCLVPFVFLWVSPYYETTMAVTYKNLKVDAIRDGRLTMEDFQ